jgi:hypothetical protein
MNCIEVIVRNTSKRRLTSDNSFLNFPCDTSRLTQSSSGDFNRTARERCDPPSELPSWLLGNILGTVKIASIKSMIASTLQPGTP